MPTVRLTAEDRLDILDLLARADDCATRRDVDGYLSLFANDAVFEGAEGMHKGRADLRETVRAVWAAEDAGSQHLTTTAFVNATAEDQNGSGTMTARAVSTLLIIAPKEPPVVVQSIRIVHTLAKGGLGWQLTRRSIGM